MDDCYTPRELCVTAEAPCPICPAEIDYAPIHGRPRLRESDVVGSARHRASGRVRVSSPLEPARGIPLWPAPTDPPQPCPDEGEPAQRPDISEGSAPTRRHGTNETFQWCSVQYPMRIQRGGQQDHHTGSRSGAGTRPATSSLRIHSPNWKSRRGFFVSDCTSSTTTLVTSNGRRPATSGNCGSCPIYPENPRCMETREIRSADVNDRRVSASRSMSLPGRSPGPCGADDPGRAGSIHPPRS